MLIAVACLHAAAQGDFLKTDGQVIRNRSGQGDTVWLYGVNFGGLFVHEVWMSPLLGANTEWDSRATLTSRFGAAQAQKLLDTYWDSWATADDFKKIAADGMNTVRMPVYFLDFMDDNGVWRKDSSGAIDFRRLDRLVNAAAKEGVYTLLDLHGAPGSQNGDRHSGKTTGANLYTTPRYQAMLVDFWLKVAEHYRDHPAIAGYDLMNEPSQTFPAAMGQNVVDLYDRCYKAIRTVDTNHIVWMEAIWAWDLLPDPKAKGWKNVAYSLHYYKWTENLDYNAMKGFIDAKVNDARKWGAQYNVPHLAGEFSFFGNPQVWNYSMDKITRENWHWTLWSYKVTDRNSSWGLYTANDGGPNKPNVATDSYEQILKKWGSWNTAAYFTRNPMVGDAAKNAAGLRKAVRPIPVPVAPAAPARGRMGLRVTGTLLRAEMPGDGTWTVAIGDTRGKTVRRAARRGRGFTVPIDGLANGAYGVTVGDGRRTWSGRVALQR